MSLTFNRVAPVGLRGEIIAADAPSASERVAWGARLHDLRAAMASTDRHTIETMVGSLLAGYPAGRGHRDEPEAVMLMFVQALSGLPAWAISAACSSWNRGEVPGKNTSFAPSPSELRDVAVSASSGFSREMLMIGKILNAEVIEERESDEVRAAVAERVRAFAAKLGAEDRAKKMPVEPAEDYDAWEARKKAEIKADRDAGKLRISAEALRALSPMMTDTEYAEYQRKQDAPPTLPTKTERAA